jgi:hypothetical protein
MDECEMAGCSDIASYWVAFKGELGTSEICEYCAKWWLSEEPESVKIKPFANNLKPFYWEKVGAK